MHWVVVTVVLAVLFGLDVPSTLLAIIVAAFFIYLFR